MLRCRSNEFLALFLFVLLAMALVPLVMFHVHLDAEQPGTRVKSRPPAGIKNKPGLRAEQHVRETRGDDLVSEVAFVGENRIRGSSTGIGDVWGSAIASRNQKTNRTPLAHETIAERQASLSAAVNTSSGSGPGGNAQNSVQEHGIHNTDQPAWPKSADNDRSRPHPRPPPPPLVSGEVPPSGPTAPLDHHSDDPVARAPSGCSQQNSARMTPWDEPAVRS